MLSLLAAKIGARPIAELTAPELLAALRIVEARGILRPAATGRGIAAYELRKNQMTAHGFRAIASTLLNESGKWHGATTADNVGVIAQDFVLGGVFTAGGAHMCRGL